MKKPSSAKGKRAVPAFAPSARRKRELPTAQRRKNKAAPGAAALAPVLAETSLLLGVGARVRGLREARNQSRRELALASSLSERFLADLESGEGNISLARLDGLCRALGTTPAWLLAEVEAQAQRSKSTAVDIAVGGAKPNRALAARTRHRDELLRLFDTLGADAQREGLDWLRARFGTSRGPMIALVGLRGAGKSTVGQALAKKLGVPFIELDARVEAAAGLTLAGIFSLHGEEYYRRLAREVLTRLLSELDAAVIATGGSIVTDPQALRLLTSRCRTVWLQATPEDHWRRVLAQGDERPSAASGNAQAELRALLQARTPLYAQAELTVDTSKLGIPGTVDAVLRAIQQVEERQLTMRKPGALENSGS